MEGPNPVSGRPPSWGAASSEGPRVSFGLPQGTPSSGHHGECVLPRRPSRGQHCDCSLLSPLAWPSPIKKSTDRTLPLAHCGVVTRLGPQHRAGVWPPLPGHQAGSP